MGHAPLKAGLSTSRPVLQQSSADPPLQCSEVSDFRTHLQSVEGQDCTAPGGWAAGACAWNSTSPRARGHGCTSHGLPEVSFSSLKTRK